MKNRNKRWSKDFIIKKLNVVTDDGARSLQSLVGQSLAIRYEESAGNTLTVSFVFADAIGFRASAPLRSGQEVELVVDHPSIDEPFEFTKSKNNELIISNIISSFSDAKREIFGFECVTQSTLSNHTTRVFKKYKGKISDSVEKILKEVLEVKSDRIDIVDESSNTYDFMGNYMRPLDCISRLSAKTVGDVEGKISPEKGSAGYFLAETERSGYRFFSVDKALKREVEEKYVKAAAKSATEVNNFSLVAPPEFVTSHDIIKKLMEGQYKSANWYYNILDRTPHFVEYSYKDSKLPSANEDQYVPNKIDEKFSRIYTTALDVGAMSDTPDLKTIAETVSWRQAHASARYQSLMSEFVKVTIPLNLSIQVGSMLNFKFPNLNTEKNKEGVNPSSGNYMVFSLAHEMGGPQGAFTGLYSVRDSFAFYSNE